MDITCYTSPMGNLILVTIFPFIAFLILRAFKFITTGFTTESKCQKKEGKVSELKHAICDTMILKINLMGHVQIF